MTTNAMGYPVVRRTQYPGWFGDRPQHAATPASGVIRFLNAIEAEMPADKTIHVILDNYATHKQLKVRAWLARHPRWTFHFVPTSCSWLNAVEGFFAKLTRRRLKNGVFHSIVDLQAAINRFIKEHNEQPHPFVRKADPNQIIAAVRRGHHVLVSVVRTFGATCGVD